MEKIKLTLGIALLSLLSACNADFTFDAYSSDFFRSESVNTPAQMAVEIPSCKSERLEQHKAKVLSIFDKKSNAKVVGCERKGMDSMLLVSLDAEIASESSDADIVLFRQSVNDTEIDGKTYEFRAVKPMLHGEFLQRIKMLMKQNHQRLSYNDVELRINLNNDERGDIMVTAYNLWVNGEAKESFRRQKLGRRGKLEFKFSNVMSDIILKGGSPIAFYVGRAK